MTEPARPAEPSELALACWGKLRPNHPLSAHLIDALELARAMLESHWGEESAARAGISRSSLASLAGLHDIGKILDIFQMREEAQAEGEVWQRLMLSGASATLSKDSSASHPHAAESMAALGRMFGSDRPGQDARLLGISAHHGPPLLLPERKPSSSWREAQQGLAEAVLEACQQTSLDHLREELQQAGQPLPGAAWAITAGVTTAADWLASANPLLGTWPASRAALRSHAQLSRRHAEQVLRAVGWRSRTALPDPPQEDRPLHREIRRAISQLPPGKTPLLIIHAPTGEGKTAAALIAARELQQRCGTRGLHVTLPNRAAGTGTWQALTQMMQEGHALALQEMLDQGGPELEPPEAELPEAVLAQAGMGSGWFSSRGRALLAPVAVGTIDQVLLAALGAHRWNHLRLWGLSNKVVCIDEVHASDPHALRLLRALLPWLHALGSPTIIMSATLDQASQASLEKAWLAQPQKRPGRRVIADAAPRSEGDMRAEPRAADEGVGRTTTEESTEAALPEVEVKLCWNGGQVHGRSSTSLPTKAVQVKRAGAKPADAAEALLSQLAPPSCGAMVMATVERAQKAARWLLQEGKLPAAGGSGPGVLALHSRMSPRMRDQRTKLLKQRCGPGAGSAERSGLIVPATSVLGISLDLDFDVLLSDPAPMDELLQRLGRLWRHQRQGRPGSPLLLMAGAHWGSLAQDPASGWREASWLFGQPALARMELAMQDELALHGQLLLPTRARNLVEAAAIPLGKKGSTLPSWLLEAEEKEQKSFEEVQQRAENAALGPPWELPERWRKRSPRGGHSVGEEDFEATRRGGRPTWEVLPIMEDRGELMILQSDDGQLEPPSIRSIAANLIPCSSAKLPLQGREISKHELVSAGWQASDLRRFPRLRPMLIDGRRAGAVPGTTVPSSAELRFDPILGLWRTKP